MSPGIEPGNQNCPDALIIDLQKIFFYNQKGQAFSFRLRPIFVKYEEKPIKYESNENNRVVTSHRSHNVINYDTSRYVLLYIFTNFYKISEPSRSFDPTHTTLSSMCSMTRIRLFNQCSYS